MATLIRAVARGGVEVRLTLPDGVRVVPPGADPSGVSELVRSIHPGLFTESGAVREGCAAAVAAATERYMATSALCAASGAMLTAVCAGYLDDVYSASVLTLNSVELTYDDAAVAAAGICRVLLDEGPADAEVMLLSLPAGPAVGRVRRRALRSGADAVGDAHRMDVGVADVHVVVPAEQLLLVLDVVCPTMETFDAHAALAGRVAASIEVAPRATEGAA